MAREAVLQEDLLRKSSDRILLIKQPQRQDLDRKNEEASRRKPVCKLLTNGISDRE